MIARRWSKWRSRVGAQNVVVCADQARCACILGSYVSHSVNPTGAWTAQAARNLFVRYPNRFTHTRALLRDRASQFVNEYKHAA